jgi:hypothetical protein
MLRFRSTYPEATASTQADTEAPQPGVSVSSFGSDLDAALCRRPHLRGLDWTPDQEEILVPEVLAVACQECPVRAACLRWAIANDEVGYWAASTSADRAQMSITDGPGDADRVRRQHLAEDLAASLHPDQPPSMWWYRAGCRCLGCRRCNRDRARAAKASPRGAA